MLKKLAAWLATLCTGALLLYDKGVRGLGWLAGPANFAEYITTPLRTYVWPYLRNWIPPMVTWQGAFFALAVVSLVYVYLGDWAKQWLSNRRKSRKAADEVAASYQITGAGGGRDEYRQREEWDARNDLMSFSIDYVLPACLALMELQNAIVGLIAFGDKHMQWAIRHSIRENDRINAFVRSCEQLRSALGGSPVMCPPLDELMHHIRTMEIGYPIFRAETDSLAETRGITYENHSVLAPLWIQWRDAHNALKHEHERVKRDIRFPKLLRPMRDSRWGELVPVLDEHHSVPNRND